MRFNCVHSIIMAGIFWRNVAQNLVIGLATVSLIGCSTPKYTIDDGRPVNEALLGQIRLLGQGEKLLRPAIVRSSALKDPDCSKQWELPFSVASSHEWEEDDRIAWVRALQVDERLTVISTTRNVDLDFGEKIVDIDGYTKNDAGKMLQRLGDLRDSGDPFQVKTASGKTVTVTPLQVCRGYTRLAPPSKPDFQDYHWLLSVHPLNLFNALVTPDEALWMVLWSQGVSEEGGGRMKTFHYSKEFLLTMLDIASVAVGVNAAAQAAKVAANQAISAAGNAATKAATEAAARQIIEQAGKEAAQAAAKEYAQRIGEEVVKTVGKQITVVLRDTFIARMGLSVSSLSMVSSTAFDEADAWAFDRMRQLGADPWAGATLHRKLLDRNLERNAFALDEERLGSLALHARKTQSEDILLAALRGASLDNYTLQLTDLPQSAREDNELPPTATLQLSATSDTPSPADNPDSMPAASDND